MLYKLKHLLFSFVRPCVCWIRNPLTNCEIDQKCSLMDICLLNFPHVPLNNNLLILKTSQAGVGWLSWSVAKSLRAFVESVFANSRVKNVVFTIQGKQAIYSCQYTGAVIG